MDNSSLCNSWTIHLYATLNGCGINGNLFFALQDISSLGLVNLRYGGYIVTVKVEAKEHVSVDSLSPMIESFDQPEGGANALNINRLLSLTA